MVNANDVYLYTAATTPNDILLRYAGQTTILTQTLSESLSTVCSFSKIFSFVKSLNQTLGLAHDQEPVILLDSYSESYADDTLVICASSSWYQGAGQCFATPTYRSKLSNVKFFVFKHGSPTGNVYAKLYQMSGIFGSNGKPTGSALAISDAVSIVGLSTSSTLVEFIFSGTNQYLMDPNSHYVITIEFSDSGDTSNYLGFRYDSVIYSHSGNTSFLKNGTWTGYISFDSCFYLYVILPLGNIISKVVDDTINFLTSFNSILTLGSLLYENLNISDVISVSSSWLRILLQDLSLSSSETGQVFRIFIETLKGTGTVSTFQAIITGLNEAIQILSSNTAQVLETCTETLEISPSLLKRRVLSLFSALNLISFFSQKIEKNLSQTISLSLLSIFTKFIPSTLLTEILNLQTSLEWLTGWNYRKSHVINAQAGAGTGYQKRIRVTKKNPLDPCEAQLGTDGLIKYGSNPIIVRGSGGTWNDTQVTDQQIIDVPNSNPVEHRAYYTGYPDVPSYANGAIGYSYAIGSDFPYTWAEYASNPVLAKGGAGTWDAFSLRFGNVIIVDGTWYMYYQGTATSGGKGSFGVATSSDGISWSKYGGNPILSEAGNIDCAWVIKVGSTWYMYYNAGEIELHVATSSDGYSWTYQGVVLTRTGGAWDSTYIEHVSVNYDGVNYVLAYEGYSGSVWSSGLATSIDPIGTFAKYSGNPVLSGSGTGWDRYHICTPSIYRDGTSVYFFYTGGDVLNPYTTSHWDIGIAVSTFIDGNENICLDNNKCRDDFGDIRFTSDNGISLLDCWMESYTTGGHAFFWVEIAEDLSDDDQTIYVYYDNSSATYPYLASTTAQGEATFSFFDDFAGADLDPDKWDTYAKGTASYSVNNSLTLITAASNDIMHVFTKDLISPVGVIAEAYFTALSLSAMGVTLAWCLDVPSSGGDGGFHNAYRYEYLGGSNNGTWRLLKDKDGSSTSLDTSYVHAVTSAIISGWWNATGLEKLYRDRILRESSTDNGLTNGDSYIDLAGMEYYGSGSQICHWILVRKFQATEPAHGDWGNEEPLPISQETITKTIGKIFNIPFDLLEDFTISIVGKIFKVLSENLHLASSRILSIFKNLTEEASFSDSFILNRILRMYENLSLFGNRVISLAREKLETLNLSSSLMISPLLQFYETLSFSLSYLFKIKNILMEILKPSLSLFKREIIEEFEFLSLMDSGYASLAIVLLFFEPLDLTGSLVILLKKAFSISLSIQSSFVMKVLISRIEDLELTEIFSLINYIPSILFLEVINLSSSLINRITLIRIELISIISSTQKVLSRSFLETLETIETIMKARVFKLLELIEHSSELLSMKMHRLFEVPLSFSDKLTKYMTKRQNEILHLGDIYGTLRRFLFQEVINISITSWRFYQKVNASILKLTDTFGMKATRAAFLEIISLQDDVWAYWRLLFKYTVYTKYHKIDTVTKYKALLATIITSQSYLGIFLLKKLIGNATSEDETVQEKGDKGDAKLEGVLDSKGS